MNIEHLFAYGTLGPADEEAVERDGWTVDAVRGRLYDLGPYPILLDLDDPGAEWVEGHVRDLESVERLRRLDSYEGETFVRRSTFTRSGVPVWVYVYVLPRPDEARGPMERWEGKRLLEWP